MASTKFGAITVNPDLDPGDTTADEFVSIKRKRTRLRVAPLKPLSTETASSRSDGREGQPIIASAAPFPAGVRLSSSFADEEDDFLKSWAFLSFDRNSRESVSSWFLRGPILVFITIAMSIDILLYVLVRQVVVLYEYIYVWSGKAAILRKRLGLSKTYHDWKRNAKILDQYLGNSKWKKSNVASGVGDFDNDLLNRTLTRLRQLRIHHTKHSDCESANRLMDVLLHTGVKPNVGGIESPILYSKAYWGTNNLVEEYVREVVLSLQHISESHDIQLDDKRAFFKNAAREYGRSALCLSGGASFGYYHLGVLRALLDVDMDEAFSDNTIPLTHVPSSGIHSRERSTDVESASDAETHHSYPQASLHFPTSKDRKTSSLLPSVFTGTSAGSLIAAMVCVRTDDELRREILVPDLSKKLVACQESWMTRLQRLASDGAMFDTKKWIEGTKEVTFGDMTFLEAYRKTGRVLNISVIPEEPNAPPKVLNYLTAPDVVIWSAVLASSAVPFVLHPVELMRKDEHGNMVPFRGSGRRWRDGSLRVDIPEQSLYRLYNVNFTIVSQVNPHVAVWFYNRRGSPGRPTSHRRGKGWRGGFVLSIMEQWLKLDIIKYLQVVREMSLLPRVVGHDPSFIFLQNFEGSVTIVPKVTFDDYTHILTDPDPRRLMHYMKGGERQTWSKVHMIANRMAIEVAIAEGRRKCVEQMQWERSREGGMQTNLSLGGVGIPDDEDDDHLFEDASDPDADLRS